MTIDEKYLKWKDIFYKYFIYKDNPSISGTNIPLERVNFNSLFGQVGDGTINLSKYLQYAYTIYLLEGDVTELSNALTTLKRLSLDCYYYFINNNSGIFFKEEPGFFFRDDIKSSDAEKFNLNQVISSYSRGIELINEDPCHSTFTSQDQDWNLLPILRFLKDKEYYVANMLGHDIFEYVVRNKHTIYNPYYSAIYHHWTYLPTFNEDKVKPWDRVKDRNSHLKYKIKVKRGANNWYFSYGFKKAFNTFDGNSKTFWSSLWYKPFIFLADRVWEPILKLFGKNIKNTSYYSMGIGADAWYDFSDVNKRLIKRFNKSLLKDDIPFMWQLAFLSNKVEDIDLDALHDWLECYPEPNFSGEVESPIIYLILYNWYKYYSKE